MPGCLTPVMSAFLSLSTRRTRPMTIRYNMTTYLFIYLYIYTGITDCYTMIYVIHLYK